MAKEIAQNAKSQPQRTPAQIEADLVSTRERLVGTIGELEARLNPKAVAAEQTQKVKSFYVDDQGSPRWDHIGYTAGAIVAGLIGIRLVSKSVRWVFAAPTPDPLPAGIVFVPVPRDQVANIATLMGSAA